MSFRYTWVLAILFIQLIFWVYFIIKRQKQPPVLFSSAMDKILARDLNKSRVTLKNNILITCLPGPTAFIPALVMSGLPSDSFIFEGFLPRKKGRKSKLYEISQNTKTTILYESPFRIIKTLSDMKETIGSDRKIAIVREISKIYEEVFRGTIQEAIQEYNEKTIKGEFVICIDKAE